MQAGNRSNRRPRPRRRSTRPSRPADASPRPDPEPELREELAALGAHVETDDRIATADVLRRLAALDGGASFDDNWLLANANAVERGEYASLSDPFVGERFMGPGGDFVIVAPYRVVREGGATVQLSLVAGQVIPHRCLTRDLTRSTEEIFGPLRQPITHVLPVRRWATAGNIGGEDGEAFVVPDGWPWPRSAQGPALNEMIEQRRRLAAGAGPLRRIFDADTAELLISIVSDDATGIDLQQREYQFHDAGHMTGAGLAMKLDGLLPTFWHRGVEEWRADGVAFELAARALDPAAAGALVASNLAVRFGVDAHRSGGLDRDTDINTALLTLDRLLRSGALAFRDKKLSLRDPSLVGLAHAVELVRANAVDLTRRELRLADPMGLLHLYGSVPVSEASRAIFQAFIIEPGRGAFGSLR